MNTAITATNVILNTAISPSLWLIPSSLVILKNPIEGYNNKLKVSNENMVFGINNTLNYYGGENKTKLQGNEIKKNEIKKNEIKKNEIKKNESKKDIKKNESKKDLKNNTLKDISDLSGKSSKIIPPKTSSENLWILSFSLVGGILISKYIL